MCPLLPSANDLKIVYPVIATTSSNDAAATTNDGIPFATP